MAAVSSHEKEGIHGGLIWQLDSQAPIDCYQWQHLTLQA